MSFKGRVYELIELFASLTTFASLAKVTLASPRTMDLSTNSIKLAQKLSQLALS